MRLEASVRGEIRNTRDLWIVRGIEKVPRQILRITKTKCTQEIKET